MNNCYGYTPGCVLSKGVDCTRQRQTCCETGTQSRESFVSNPRGTGVLQKIVWLPKAIRESGFSVYLVLQRESSPTTHELCVSRKASSLFSPSFFFPFTHSLSLNFRSACNRGLSLRAAAAVAAVIGPVGPAAIPPIALNVGGFSSPLTQCSIRV
jgi:hypothetical protein